MTAASGPRVVRLRSGDLVQTRQVQPRDAPALAAAYENLGEQSRYRRFFTLIPELSGTVLTAATDVDHHDHEAFVATPLLGTPAERDQIVAECRFVRYADRPDTADLAVTVVDSWQGRGLGTALLDRLSERASELGIAYFTAEVLAENKAMLAMLPALGTVETESFGPVVSAHIAIAAAARGDIVCIPGPLRRLVQVSDALAHIVLLPVTTALRVLSAPDDEDRPQERPR
ncbi:GNAT family N-acetyltransferase [Pseudonocardia sp. GCM10023141]|uniref:GNAT family N-acetyltransferase n=1 Tax=Pseudonocardia sp. GCM10023141 TaxID=3252653 RepID=UPI003612E9EF